MGFPLIKLILLLAIAFVLGVAAGWWMWGRREERVAAPLIPARSPLRPGGESVEDSVRPATGESQDVTVVTPVADLERDDLKRIRGVGPSLERTLNDLGVTRFAQIAGWTESDIARVDERLRFRGRIQRDDWQGQARELMSGG